jgi:hypothetical protein
MFMHTGIVSVARNIGSSKNSCQYEKSRKPLRKAIYLTFQRQQDMSHDLSRRPLNSQQSCLSLMFPATTESSFATQRFH